ncbi:MAG: DUF4191 domain-containing protein [Candidatus Nanopelagicales bacterium]|nr:DUF4191 domain-containing protein [Candidatus Nanopelagicales bacterium]
MAKGKIRSTLSSITQNWAMTQKVYRALPLEVGGLFLLGFVVGFVPTLIFLNLFTAILVGIPLGLLAAIFWFSRRAMKAAYRQIEGQPGAAAAVVQSLRGGWLVTPGIAVNKNQDLISRVVGKPGVILVSEGPSSRVGHMLGNERKKTARWLPDIPIYEIQVGDEPGQVSLGKLQRSLTKLPRNLRGGEITEVRRRLDAVSQTGGSLPIPKGPMPTSARAVRRPR